MLCGASLLSKPRQPNQAIVRIRPNPLRGIDFYFTISMVEDEIVMFSITESE